VINQNTTKKPSTSAITSNFGPVNRKQCTRRAFTLLELMVVVMIIAILAGVTVSILCGRVDSAKWSEANAAAGTIRTAVSTYVARKSIDSAQSALVGKSLSDYSTQAQLGFVNSDLTGTYFVPGDYTIASIDSCGHATIRVTASKDNAPQGTRTLFADGNWQ
jgi:type IV pilus assembly protein PilA